MKAKAALGALAAVAAMTAASFAQAGSLFTTQMNSQTLGRAWRYSVYLPTGYQSSGLRYPVLYLLHGRGDSETSWATGGKIKPTLDRLIASGDIPPTIAIMPSAGSSWYVDSAEEKMETAIIKELIPAVDGAYRTIQDRQGRAVVGYSMGGYGAIRYALAYPELFGAATLLSAALYDADPPEDSSAREFPAFGSPFNLATWTERNYPKMLESFLPKKLSLPIFIAAGDDEYINTRYRDNAEVQATELYARLRKAGQRAQLRILNGGHDWNVWAPAYVEGLKYMFVYLRRPELVPGG
jgi:enterochelin esterase-like enzyme